MLAKLTQSLGLKQRPKETLTPKKILEITTDSSNSTEDERPRSNDQDFSDTSNEVLTLACLEYSQAQSKFFSLLPLEIRQMIYAELFQSVKVHIIHDTHLRGSLLHMICHDMSGPSTTHNSILCCGDLYATHEDSIQWRRMQAWQKPPAITAPLKACRRLYDEGIDELYKSIIFSWDSSPSLQIFEVQIPRHRFELLHSVELYHEFLPRGWQEPSYCAWMEATSIFKNLPKLEDLHVDLSMCFMWEVEKSQENEILEIASEIHLPEKWNMTIHWSYPNDRMRCHREREDLPFVIERKLYSPDGVAAFNF